MVVAHIAGVPVEETLLSFAPLGAAGVGGLAAYARHRMGRGWQRAPRARPRPRAARARFRSS